MSMIQLHKMARTTPAIRKEIREATLPERELARKYNITRETVRKWKKREDQADRSHRPHKMHTTLSPVQEEIVVELRKTLLLPLDDLLVVTRQFINPNASRSGLSRCLRRHGVSNLKALLPEEEKDSSPQKTFRDYEPGFVHVDVKYLPRMPDEERHGYLFAAIDRATRWVYIEILKDKSARSAASFLKRFLEKAPFRIAKVLTDNGKEFTDRFDVSGECKPTGRHPFDLVCQDAGLEHRLIKPRHPQTNSMIERFNGRVEEVVTHTRFPSSKGLRATLYRYVRLYNHQIPQKALGHVTPVQALKKWQEMKLEPFTKTAYDLSRYDT